MRKIETRNEKLGISKSQQPTPLFTIYYLLITKACGQTAHNQWYVARTNSLFNHRAGYKNVGPVHKTAGFTLLGAQLPTSKLPVCAQLFLPFYRLALRVVPIIHRAYIYDKKLNLMNI